MGARAGRTRGAGTRLHGADQCAAEGLDAARVDKVAARRAQELAAGEVQGQWPARRHRLAGADGDGVEGHEERTARTRGRVRCRGADGLAGAVALQAERIGELPHLPGAREKMCAITSRSPDNICVLASHTSILSALASFCLCSSLLECSFRQS